MRFATRISPCLATLALALAAAPGDARAGIAVMQSTIMPIGDPHYEYIFSLVLEPGSQLRAGDFITIYDVKGLDPNAFTNQPGGLYTFVTAKLGSGIPSGPAYPPGVDQTKVSDDAAVYNATWEYISPSNLPTGGVTTVPLALGDFKIRTVGAFGDLPVPPLETLIYASQTHDASGNLVGEIGMTTPTLVPEPSAIVLVGTGAVALLLMGRIGRRPRA